MAMFEQLTESERRERFRRIVRQAGLNRKRAELRAHERMLEQVRAIGHLLDRSSRRPARRAIRESYDDIARDLGIGGGS